MTSIGWNAFNGCSNLTSITIPNSVTSIGSSAFYGCKALTSISIPNSVTSIGNSAFKGCSSLTSITIPNSVMSIGEDAFIYCSIIDEVIVSCIDNNDFANYVSRNDILSVFHCNGLSGKVHKLLIDGKIRTSITIPNSVTWIGSDAFCDCTGLTSITIPNSVKSIRSYAFSGCSSLTSITIPNSVTSIGSLPFHGCSGLTSISVEVGNQYYDSRDNCNAIIRKEDNSLIAGCKNTNIPNSVTSIEGRAFSGCSSLTSITIPNSVTSIGGSAFYGCSGLTTMRNLAIIPQDLRGYYDVFTGSSISNATLYVPSSSVEAYKSAVYWGAFKEILPIYSFIAHSNDTSKGDVAISGKGYSSETNTIDGDAETDVTITAIPKSEYHFLNWTENGNVISTENPYTLTVSNDRNLIANFAINEYSITFDTDGGSSIAPIKQDYGTAITKPTNPTKTGNTFAGWDKEIPETMPSGGMTIKALWKANQYTITFNTDGGSSIAAIKQGYGTQVTKPADPTKTGYTFAGWEKEVPETMPAEDITIKAKWTVNKYTITFDTDGGSAVEAITQNYGSNVTKPANPTKEYYTFAGWEKKIPSTMPAENLTIKALWKAIKYNVKFILDGVTVIDKDMAYGSEITPPTITMKEGYTFSGWSPEVDKTVPAKDVTYTAKFTVNKYNLIYMVDGEEYRRVPMEYGSVIYTIPIPSKENYMFSGWSCEYATVPAKDIVLSGTFIPLKHNVYVIVDGKTIDLGEYSYGETIILPEMASREGCTWQWDENNPKTMASTGVTLKGKYVPNKYNITYILNMTVVGTMEVAYGEAIPTFEYTPSNPDITILGWRSDQEYTTMPAKDIVYMADFTDGIGSIMSGKRVNVFTLSGAPVKVNVPVEELNNVLPQGIYIIDGKKIEIK